MNTVWILVISIVSPFSSASYFNRLGPISGLKTPKTPNISNRIARHRGVQTACLRCIGQLLGVPLVQIRPPQLEVFSFQLLRDTLQPSELTIRPAQRRQGRECETQSRR